MVGNKKSSSWEEIGTKSPHQEVYIFSEDKSKLKKSNTCPEERVAEEKGEDDGERSDDVGGQENHSLTQNCKTNSLSAVKVRMNGLPS